MITIPRLSLTETKSSRKESSFPAKMPLIKSVPRKFVALYHKNTKIRLRSDERDKLTPTFCTIDGTQIV